MKQSCNVKFYIVCICLMFLQNLYANTTDLEVKDKAQSEKNKKQYKIDYQNLDSKYYPYIHNQNKYYDKDIMQVIRNVDKAERKNSFFIGVIYGININAYYSLFGNQTITNDSKSKHTEANFSLFGLHAGYQKYTSNMLPTSGFGYQVYIDFCTSFGKNGIFFTGINFDILWDFIEFKGFLANLNAGLGVGGAKIAGLAVSPYGDKYEGAYRLNLGISIRKPIYHQKIGIYFGSIQGLERGFLGYTMTIGYDYVF